MTRSQYEQSIATKRGIIHALKDNLGDEFSALDIASAMLDPPDLKPMQVSSVLKSMVADGLVSKRPSKNMNVYRLTKKALTWQPAPYDWRAEGAKAPLADTDQTPAVAKPPAAGKVNGTPVNTPPAAPIGQLDPKRQRQPADDHPWVHPPAVLPATPKAAPVTRPLPAHLETKADPFEASSQPVVDNSSHLENLNNSTATLTKANQPEIPDSSSAPEVSRQGSLDDSSHSAPQIETQKGTQNNRALAMPAESHEDEPPAQPKITPAAISGCGGKGECGGHCANHAKDGDEDYLAESLERALAEIANLTDNIECLESYKESLANQLSEAQSKLADALADLAASQRERDLLHQRLREQASHEPAMMADCLMELLRLALLRIPHPDHYAGVGKMVGSEVNHA